VATAREPSSPLSALRTSRHHASGQRSTRLQAFAEATQRGWFVSAVAHTSGPAAMPTAVRCWSPRPCGRLNTAWVSVVPSRSHRAGRWLPSRRIFLEATRPGRIASAGSRASANTSLPALTCRPCRRVARPPDPLAVVPSSRHAAGQSLPRMNSLTTSYRLSHNRQLRSGFQS